MSASKQRVRPIAAIRALRALLSNPEDTKQVFLITEALNGNSSRRDFDRFRASEIGRTILAERRVLLDHLRDQQRLSQLPPGTLGRDYVAFMAEEGLSPDGLVEASRANNLSPSAEDFRLFGERGRDWHDLQHVLTGYGRDGLGEVCVLTFLCAQSWNPGLLLIAIAGMFKVAKEIPGLPVKRAVWEAWRHGRRAAWLQGLDWEGLLPQPLDVIRPRLGILPPFTYQRILACFEEPAPAGYDPALTGLAAQ